MQFRSQSDLNLCGQSRSKVHTGQVPPEMTRSKDRASGIPAGHAVLFELHDSPREAGFSDPFMEERDELT